MALSGLDIYKLLPKTNCKECGFATCLAFAMQLAKKAVSIEKCPFLSEDAKKMLEASSLPPIKLVTIGQPDRKLEVGNETVLFRHEEKFHHPAGIGFILQDSLSDEQLAKKAQAIDRLQFERVGQKISVDLVALAQTGSAERFLKAVQLVSRTTTLSMALVSNDPAALQPALEFLKGKKPLIYPDAAGENISRIGGLAASFKVPMVAVAPDLDKLSQLTRELNSLGVQELLLDTGKKPLAEKIWDLTQLRRQALKKSNRSLGYPALAVVDCADPYEEVMEAATYISKYAGIVLLKGDAPWQALALLTLRQNIYTDPQKPLQIEPKLYPIGNAGAASPVLVTTNFSLSYYTVLGEVEASRVPSYIMSVDTEGMSVLTAWAAEKFTPEKITASLKKFNVADTVSHRNLVIPGYVAVMSGQLEEDSGWKVVVGPKEAAGIPSFLKNL
ncbi:MAG TPA: acetyl-CoA decarbonylase/synthase complex subunit gamma [Patescibacteria group bacterium]|nr:acetyl-CoA decarbonylase/synthase complex subunit gamma [Patescibacteria group bacterium]